MRRELGLDQVRAQIGPPSESDRLWEETAGRELDERLEREDEGERRYRRNQEQVRRRLERGYDPLRDVETLQVQNNRLKDDNSRLRGVLEQVQHAVNAALDHHFGD